MDNDDNNQSNNTAPEGFETYAKQALDTLFGSGPKTQDSIEPEASPIDVLAGGVGSKIGGALAEGAEGIIGNEIGSIGRNIKPVFTPGEAGEVEYKGLIDKAKDMFPDAKSFDELYKAADEKFHSSHPIMKALQQVKNRNIDLQQVQGLAKGGIPQPIITGTPPNSDVYKLYAEGGGVEGEPWTSNIAQLKRFEDGGEVPSGLDEFIKTPESLPKLDNSAPNQTTSSAAPEGLDEFVAPELQQEKYGTPSQQAIAGLESAARGVAGPLATGFETHVLGVPEEAILGRKEANPITSVAGEAIGLGGSLMTGFGEAALAAKAGEAALGALGAAEAVSNVAKIGSAAAKAAIENMVVQGSDEISKKILNDPNQSAESAAADIGLSGILGGAFGAAGPLWNATIGQKVHGVLESIANKTGGIEGITPDIVNEGINKLGLDVPPEVRAGLSNDPQLRGMFQKLQESSSASGEKAKTAYKEFKVGTQNALLGALGKTPKDVEGLTEISDHEVGQKLIKTLTGELDSLIEPISKNFEHIKDKYKGVEVTHGTRGEIADAISNMAQIEGYDLSPSAPQSKIIQNVFKELPNIKTLEDVRKYSSILGDTVSSNPELYRVGGQLKKILRDAEDNLVTKTLAEDAPELLEKHATARSSYKSAMDLIDSLNDRLHVGKYAGPASFVKALKEMAPEDVLRRLSPKGDAGILDILDKFPGASGQLRDAHLDQLLKKAVDKAEPGEILSARTLFTNLEKASPEMRNFLVPQESAAKVDAIKAILNQLPTKIPAKPEHLISKVAEYLPASAIGLGTMLFGHNPVLSAIVGGLAHHLGKDVPDAIRLSLLKFLGTSKPINPEGFNAAVNMISSAVKGDALANKAVKSIFRGASMIPPRGIIASLKERDQLDKELQKLRENPEGILKVAGNTDHYVPDMGAATNQIASTAVNYLNGLLPKKDGYAPLDNPDVAISALQKAAYNNALDIAQQPLSILHKVKTGTIVPQDVQTMSTIYPALYKNLQQKVTDQLTESVRKGDTVPYATRLGLSMFLGQPLDSTLKPQSIISAQLVQQKGGQQQGQANAQGPQQGKGVKHSTAPLTKLPANNMTRSQSRESHQQQKG